MTNFYEKTTVAFDVTIYINGVAQDISSDIVSLIIKNRKDDTDEEAVLAKNAGEVTTDGIAKFTLTATETAIICKGYFYEIKWLNDANVYIIESSTVKVLERVFD